MRRADLLTLVSVVLPATAAPVPKSIRRAHATEMNSLQGTWVLVSREEGGRVWTATDETTRFVITGNRWEWVNGTTVGQSGTFKLTDITSRPKQWEYKVTGAGVGYSIYDVDEGTFRYCSSGSADTRPTEFATGVKGGGAYCCVWKRKE